MLKKFMDIVKDEEGATMVEYALMVALIAIAVLVVGNITGLSDAISNTFGDAAEHMNNN